MQAILAAAGCEFEWDEHLAGWASMERGGPALPEALLRSVRANGLALKTKLLPPPGTTRWVVRRKAELVAAVNGGLMTFEEVCERYGLTFEEFASWKRAIERSGMPGLRVTRIQHYKSLYERQQRY